MWLSQQNPKHNATTATLNTVPIANTHSFPFNPGKMVSPVQNNSTLNFAVGSLTPVCSKTRRGSRGSGDKASLSTHATRSGVIVPTKEELAVRKKEERMEKERKAHNKRID